MVSDSGSKAQRRGGVKSKKTDTTDPEMPALFDPNAIPEDTEVVEDESSIPKSAKAGRKRPSPKRRARKPPSKPLPKGANRP